MHPLFFNISQIFYPTLCNVCSSKIQNNKQVLCYNCYKEMPLVGDYYTNNPTEKIFWGRFPFGFAYSHLYFQKNNITQHLIHAFKYQQKPEIAQWLGELMGKKLLEIPMAVDDNIILPVPLSEKKLYVRGYNQSLEIAKGIAKVTNFPIANQNLLRIKDTATQTNKSRLERFKNMSEAFEIDNTKEIEGKQIIIVDDVITTGATIESCALQLLKIPKVKISVISCAYANN